MSIVNPLVTSDLIRTIKNIKDYLIIYKTFSFDYGQACKLQGGNRLIEQAGVPTQQAPKDVSAEEFFRKREHYHNTICVF